MSKHDQIAHSLTQEILQGQYRPGERLPSERDLAARFDANRGAVREAMKKLEHLGIACIQPGGARVAPLEEASLDVIEPLLEMGTLPNEKLVDNIMQVVQSLAQVAAESTATHALAEQLDEIRALVRPLYEEDLNQEQHAIARFTLMHAIMTTSDNLVCQLIARSLLVRLAPKMAPLNEHFSVDLDAHRVYARQLDGALASRDLEAIRGVFDAFAKLNREAIARAYDSYHATQHNNAHAEVAVR